MDWYSWLSKTCLDPIAIYEYSLALVQNELEEEDIPYFNHEFLQSIGISIAKHRLEILKLSRKYRKKKGAAIIRSFLAAIKRTKANFSDNLRAWRRRDNSALAIVPYTGDKTKTKPKKRSAGERLFLTNGSPPRSIDGFQHHRVVSENNGYDYEDDWCVVAEEIKWDAMFQNLKPT